MVLIKAVLTKTATINLSHFKPKGLQLIGVILKTPKMAQNKEIKKKLKKCYFIF
jgi:hypothetical protein